MKTKITKPDGTVIEIEGTADEVADVVREAGGLPAQLAPVVSPMPLIPYDMRPCAPPAPWSWPPARVPGPYEWVPDSQRFIITSADTPSAQRDIEPILGEA